MSGDLWSSKPHMQVRRSLPKKWRWKACFLLWLLQAKRCLTEFCSQRHSNEISGLQNIKSKHYFADKALKQIIWFGFWSRNSDYTTGIDMPLFQELHSTFSLNFFLRTCQILSAIYREPRNLSDFFSYSF